MKGKAVKIVKIEFVQYDGVNYDELKEFCGSRLKGKPDYGRLFFEDYEISCFVEKGDCVVKNSGGSYQVFTEKGFNLEYQVV